MPRRRGQYQVPESVARQLRRRRWTRRSIFAALLLLALSALFDRAGFFRYRGDDWKNYDRQTVVVTRVIDGDTVRVRRSPESPEETIRLLGIDAPEISHDADKADDHWGREATDHLKELIDGQSVTVRLDATQTRDRYARLLAYLHLGDAESINQQLVRDGDAYAYRPYHHSMRRQFEQSEDEARLKPRGLWENLGEDQMPAWRQRWLAERRNAAAKR
jgi:micrococcal nuclease